MAAFDHDGGRAILHQGEFSAPHVTTIGLQQEGCLIARGAKPGAVIEYAPIAAIGDIPGRFSWALR